MNVANCRRSVALLVYCGVAVLVIVNGQSTTDDDIDKEEINRQLIDIVAELKAELAKSTDTITELRAQQAKTEGQLASMPLPVELAETSDQLATSMGGSGLSSAVRLYIIKLHNYL